MQEEQTDAHLVMRAQADDTEAFTLLIERYQELLLCIALRSVGDKEIAHDLVQEALLQAYLSLDQLRDAARFKNWLYGIVLNLCRNWVRTYKGGAHALHTSLEDDTSLLTYPDDTCNPDPQELVVEQELHHLVREAVSLLSPKNRTAMQLFYYDGLSLLQIAHHLDISLAAVKSRIHKGRDQLRAHLKTLYPELAETPIRKERQTHMVTVILAKVLNQVETYPRRTILVLLDEQHQRALPLWFRDIPSHQSGRVQPFAQEKEIPLESLTTDLLVRILSASETTVEEITIDALQREILYARIKIRSVNATHTVKASLNDALPLALRLKCPLAVSEEVLTSMGIQLADWGKTLEQQIDAVATLAAKTPIGPSNSQATLHFSVPRNLSFEDGLLGWRFSGHSTCSIKEYDAQIDEKTTYNNNKSVVMSVQQAEPSEMRGGGDAMLMHEGFLADSYRGQRMRMITHVKAQGVSSAFFAINIIGIELTPEQERTQAKTRIVLVPGRAFEGTHDWKRYELVFNVPDDATSIQVGCKMRGEGKVWIDGFQFERVDTSVPLTGTQQLVPTLQHPRNLDFAQELENWHMSGSFTQDYTYGIDHTATGDGTASMYVKADKTEPRGSAMLVQTMSDQNYRNKRVHFSGIIKTVGVTQKAGIAITLDLGDKIERKETIIVGNTDWMRNDLTFDVPDHAQLDFGLILYGRGQAWLQDVRLEIVETP